MTRGAARSRARRALAGSVLLLGTAALASCQEEKVVHYKPFLTGIEGAKTQTPAVLNDKDRPIVPAGAPEEKIVISNADGTQRLVTHDASQLIAHIKRTLADDDAVTFTEQVLSEQTRQEFRARGMDPAEAFQMVKADEKDVQKLLARMPMGEHTPFVLEEPVADNTLRVRVTGLAAKDLKWAGFDMVLESGRFVEEKVDGKEVKRFERGNWRLRWFVP